MHAVDYMGIPVDCLNVWYGKTRIVGIAHGEKKSLRMYFIVASIQPTNVTDRQTDGQAQLDGIGRAMHSVGR